MSSAYATTQQERLIECSKAIHSRNVGKDCRIPIFGFGATILLNLLFLILQDNIELKARAMGVWEVISGLQTVGIQMINIDSTLHKVHICLYNPLDQKCTKE